MPKSIPPKIAVIAFSLGAISILTIPVSANAGQEQLVDVTERKSPQLSSNLTSSSLLHRQAPNQIAEPLLLAQEKATIKQRQPARKLSSPQIKARWRYDTWRTDVVRKKLKNPDGTAQIPDTDCPPLPAQTCLDSWKDPNDDIANWPD